MHIILNSEVAYFFFEITIPNSGYIGLALMTHGDIQLAMMFIPAAIQFLFSVARGYGYNDTQTLTQFGNFTGKLLSTAFPGTPLSWFPAGFAPWLSLHNKTVGSPLYGSLRNNLRKGYNLTEMNALKTVLQSPSLLGTTGNATLTAQCTANPTIKGCGYLFYIQAYQSRYKQGFPSNDTILQRLLVNIQEIFCQPASDCLKLDPATSAALPIYITDHLAKLSIYLATDKLDFGPLMTRTVKQISHGFTERDLKVPLQFPNGLVVPGILPLDDINTDKPSWKYYTCRHTTKAFQFKGKMLQFFTDGFAAVLIKLKV